MAWQQDQHRGKRANGHSELQPAAAGVKRLPFGQAETKRQTGKKEKNKSEKLEEHACTASFDGLMPIDRLGMGF